MILLDYVFPHQLYLCAMGVLLQPHRTLETT